MGGSQPAGGSGIGQAGAQDLSSQPVQLASPIAHGGVAGFLQGLSPQMQQVLMARHPGLALMNAKGMQGAQTANMGDQSALANNLGSLGANMTPFLPAYAGGVAMPGGGVAGGAAANMSATQGGLASALGLL